MGWQLGPLSRSGSGGDCLGEKISVMDLPHLTQQKIQQGINKITETRASKGLPRHPRDFL
jgi:hypothetical protein